MAENSFDVVVIGSGPGGYVAAIRAAQLGMKTAIVEKDKHMGGTCLNVGCIPSKSLLHSTELYHFMEHDASKHGIEAKSLKADIAALMKKKDGVVTQLRGGIKALMKANKIEVFQGHGELKSATEIEVSGKVLSAKNIILATGSSIIELPFMKFDGQTIVSSDDAIAFDSVPKNIVVVGAGAIGLELGSVWNRLGADVTIVELLPRIAITFDHEISKMAQRIFTKQGLKFELDTKVTGVKKKGKGHVLTAEKGGKEVEFPADKIIVCVGRKPYADKLGLDNAGLSLDEKGRIPTNGHCQTSVPNIYAIGDVTDGPMLAHKAEEEGVAVAEILAGQAGHVPYDKIPNVIYTAPELASVGISEQEAKEQGIAAKTGKFSFAANGRALANDATDGFVKVIACAKTDKLLGVQILGHNSSELISAAVTHMEYGGSAEDMARTITAHPTMAEALKEAAMSVDKWSIHSM
jgi:dihydrolipoamide dehydrogenase